MIAEGAGVHYSRSVGVLPRHSLLYDIAHRLNTC